MKLNFGFHFFLPKNFDTKDLAHYPGVIGSPAQQNFGIFKSSLDPAFYYLRLVFLGVHLYAHN